MAEGCSGSHSHYQAIISEPLTLISKHLLKTRVTMGMLEVTTSLGMRARSPNTLTLRSSRRQSTDLLFPTEVQLKVQFNGIKKFHLRRTLANKHTHTHTRLSKRSYINNRTNCDEKMKKKIQVNGHEHVPTETGTPPQDGAWGRRTAAK